VGGIVDRRRLKAELAGSTLKEEDMRHPSSVWTDPDFATERLDKLVTEYVRHLEGRSQPVSPDTIDKYRKSLLSLMRSMTRQNVPPVLESLTPAVVGAWIQEQRKAGKSEVGISTRLGAVKIFTNKYLLKHLELTTKDLLTKVPRFTPPEKPAQVLTDDEVQAVLETFSLPTYADIRNKALVATYIATGMRLREVVELPLNSLDRATGEIKFFRGKGNKERCAWISPGALKYVRAYLRIRPRTAEDARLWIQDDGTPYLFGACSQSCVG